MAGKNYGSWPKRAGPYNRGVLLKHHIPMRLLSPALLFTILCTSGAALTAQTPTSPSPATAQASKTPSAILQPALDALQQTLDTLRLDKWKTSGAVRDETDANISSIHRDLESTLPPLLAAADGAPDSVAKVLPAFRNIEALYDVLLRVAQVGRLSAPSAQSAALDQAMAALEDGRHTLGDRLQAAALAQEKQVGDLKAALRAVPPAPAAAPAACPPPPPAKKRKPQSKPAQKPAPAPTS
jgi:hypothetical protein